MRWRRLAHRIARGRACSRLWTQDCLQLIAVRLGRRRNRRFIEQVEPGHLRLVPRHALVGIVPMHFAARKPPAANRSRRRDVQQSLMSARFVSGRLTSRHASFEPSSLHRSTRTERQATQRSFVGMICRLSTIDCRQWFDGAFPTAFDRDDVGTRAQPGRVVCPLLQHLAALLDKLCPVVGTDPARPSPRSQVEHR